MLYSIATRGLFLLTTTFYDDFIIASPPELQESSKNSMDRMELIFMLTGWSFATDGKKATVFSNVCKALGVEFDCSRSQGRILQVGNTESRRQELLTMLEDTIKSLCLDKTKTLVLIGKLGSQMALRTVGRSCLRSFTKN